MWTRQHRSRNLGRLILPSVTALFLSYFGFHAWHGEYGIYSKYTLEERTAELQKQLSTVHQQRVALETRVRLLQDGTLHRDILDEQARRALNLAHADELVILRAPAQQQ
ncbi:FtsB family cell division protein [Tianweitania sediminis]|uniref:Septum formation initiator family protein n=1 Tax=Tianweitania sediminis TaxID=1502156 RepID=A0A8J7RNB6_9HYPH|nr:septum formation initiator family protein [Tianweitania sediminis]HEV7417478.1 septum formation initiator family protein [Tianweitania sediminis]